MGRFAASGPGAAVIAAVIIAASGALGVNVALGAHPFWAMQVSLIGIGLGAVLFGLGYLCRGHWVESPVVAALLLLLSFGATSLGKARFVASYAEDFVAGRMWYFGWMATMCFAYLLIARLLAGRHRQGV